MKSGKKKVLKMLVMSALMAGISATAMAAVGVVQGPTPIDQGMANKAEDFTIYNDKEMSSQYSDYKKKVSEWEEKLKDIEDSYYKKFAKMESALSKLQSQAYLESKRLDRYNTEEI